jgi:hypothetical protein
MEVRVDTTRRRAGWLAGAALAVTIAAVPIVASASSSAPASPRGRPAADESAKVFGRAVQGQRHTLPRVDAAGPPGSRTDGTAGGFVFVPITPFRTFDSRAYQDGFFFGGEETWFTVLTDVNDVPMIPTNAVAVTYNLAITNALGAGFVGIFPANSSWPGNASINWTSTGTTLSNGGTVAIGFYDGPGQIALFFGPGTPANVNRGVGTDFVIDITGYYI